MTANNSREHTPKDGKKKSGYYYKEVTDDERAAGTSNKDLGACCGRDKVRPIIVGAERPEMVL